MSTEKLIPAKDVKPLLDALRAMIVNSAYWTKRRCNEVGEAYSPSDEEKDATTALDTFQAFHGIL